MRIYLIRHGEVKDKKLTENGYKQIINLDFYYKKLLVNKIFSSDMNRSKQTALSLSKSHNRKVIVTKNLRELEVVRDKFNDKNLSKFLKNLLSKKYKNVFIVCHGYVIRWFISKLTGIPFENTLKLSIYPCSTTLLVTDGVKGKAIFINNYNYLPKKIRGPFFYD